MKVTLWSDCACVPTPSNCFQLPALVMEACERLQSCWGAALLHWGLGSVVLLHVRMLSGEVGAHFTFWDSCLLMGLLRGWSFVLEPTAEVWAHLWTGVWVQQDKLCESLAGPYPWQCGGGGGGRA